MESLKVRTGQVSLKILDDSGNERGIFKFNPEDITTAKKFLTLQTEFAEKQVDFEARASACKTTEEKADMLEELVTYFEGIIDRCFGEGTSELLFGNAKTLSMFEDFFEGITPYYEKASNKRMAKYN